METLIGFKDLGQNIELKFETDYGDGTGSSRKLIIPKDIVKVILKSLEEKG